MAENFWDIDIDFGNLDFGDDEKKLIVSTKSVPSRLIKYENAVKLAKQTDLRKMPRYECIVKGDFIYGDYIEALFVENDIYTEELTISTLSLGYENVDSINNLIQGGYVGNVRLLASVYFYANERKKGGVIDYLFKTIEKGKIQCAFADVHTKVVTFKTEGGRHITIKGSANLRSSGCTENFTIEDNKEIFDFFDSYHNDIFQLVEENGGGMLRKTVMNKKLNN